MQALLSYSNTVTARVLVAVLFGALLVRISDSNSVCMASNDGNANGID